MIALNDKVNFGLRKRIYYTERAKYELEWQKKNVWTFIQYNIIQIPNIKDFYFLKMILDKETLLKEINKLEDALDRKLNSKKLVESRYEERLYRDEVELCLDKPTLGLQKENALLDNSTKMLNDKLNQTK